MKSIIASSLPLLSLLVMAPALPAGQLTRNSLQRQNILLLQRVADTANEVLSTAERIESYNRVPNEYSRECHMYQLDALKEQINAMTHDLDRLALTRNGLDTADRRAIERVLTVAVELAHSANQTIVEANRMDATPGLSVEYRKLASDCYRQSEMLVKALSACIEELK
jgi:uncharacterized protein YutE (UPF0331/DUF86 family)